MDLTLELGTKTLVVVGEFDKDGELEMLVTDDVNDHYLWPKRDDVVRLRDHLNEVLRASETHQWGVAWSERKRHVVDETKMLHTVGRNTTSHCYQQAICNDSTYVYFGGADRFPALNSDAVMAKPACKLCERKIAR